MQSFNHTQDLQGMATGLSPRSGPEPLIRDAMEAARLAWRHTPEADYPDGYLGTTTARREDKLANAVWRNKKSYDRGAHKGERLDMSDYLWPDVFNLETGLRMEAAGSKFTSRCLRPGTCRTHERRAPRSSRRGGHDGACPTQVCQ